MTSPISLIDNLLAGLFEPVLVVFAYRCRLKMVSHYWVSHYCPQCYELDDLTAALQGYRVFDHRLADSVWQAFAWPTSSLARLTPRA